MSESRVTPAFFVATLIAFVVGGAGFGLAVVTQQLSWLALSVLGMAAGLALRRIGAAGLTASTSRGRELEPSLRSKTTMWSLISITLALVGIGLCIYLALELSGVRRLVFAFAALVAGSGTSRVAYLFASELIEPQATVQGQPVRRHRNVILIGTSLCTVALIVSGLMIPPND